MVVSISGHGCSGSSAVEDLLEEYDDIKMNKKADEVTILYIPDGILDLEYHIMKSPQRFFSCDVALLRFVRYVKRVSRSPHSHYNRSTDGKFREITMKYVNSITQIQWKGYWYFDLFDCSEVTRTMKFRIFDRIWQKVGMKFNRKIYTFLDRPMYLSVCPDNFYEASKEYMRELFAAMDIDIDEKVVVNQLFAGNNPESGMQFFDDAKTIVVERDPRDVYMMLREYTPANGHWFASDTVEEFVTYFLATRRCTDYSSSNVLLVQFEDLIYRTEEVEKEIENFLDIHEHTRKRQIFNPAKSMNNTQIFLGYKKYEKEIKYIEEHLAQYIYDFSKYEKSDFRPKEVY